MSETVLVLCTLDSGTTVTTTFGFTALTILGGSAKAIRTTTPGLGIAIPNDAGYIIEPLLASPGAFIYGQLRLLLLTLMTLVAASLFLP